MLKHRIYSKHKMKMQLQFRITFRTLHKPRYFHISVSELPLNYRQLYFQSRESSKSAPIDMSRPINESSFWNEDEKRIAKSFTSAFLQLQKAIGYYQSSAASIHLRSTQMNQPPLISCSWYCGWCFVSENLLPSFK